MNSGKPFGPGAAEKFGEHGFGLVVPGVRGRDHIKRNPLEQLPEPGIAQPARGLFDAFAGFARGRIGLGRRSGVDSFPVQGKAEPGGQVSDKCQIGIGLGASQTVMKMRHVKDQTEFPAPLPIGLGQGAEQGDRIGSTRNRNRNPQPGTKITSIDGKAGRHMAIIAPLL